MKKLILLGACAVMAFSASAQMSLVKDLAKMASSGNPEAYMNVLEKIEPALTNPESANDVLTWYTAGKAAFGLFDKMYEMKLMQQPVDDNMMGAVLTEAYNFYQKALPLDTIIEMDKNGTPKLNKDGSKKFKTKYSKEIVGALISHLGDIANVGNACLQNSDWENCAKAFANYANLSTAPFAIANGVAPEDSTLAQVRFFEGYAEYSMQDFANAYNAFSIARKLGYTDNSIVDFQTSSLANLVQGMLDAQDYAKAYAFIDNALASDANNGTLWDIKGFTTELEKGIDEALPLYMKAVEVEPNYANAHFDIGRCLYLQAQKIIDDNPNATNKDLVPKIQPIYEKAIPFLKKAMELDPSNTKPKNVLDDILYKFEVMGVKI